MYHARSGGLRTVVDTLGRGYAAAGHDRILIVPGARSTVAHDEHGTVITVPGTPVTGGYRMIFRPERVLRILDSLGPDSVEVSDKVTLAGAGPWARARGVRAVLFSHERLDSMVAHRVGASRLPRGMERAVGRWTRHVMAGFDEVVSTSAFGERELTASGARSIRRVPLGVDLEVFRPRLAQDRAAPNGPRRADHPGGASEYGYGYDRPHSAAAQAPVRLAYSGRLSTEKSPQIAVETIRVLRQWGVDVTLDVYGSGPLRATLERRAAKLPVTFHGHLADRSSLAARLARADLVLAPAACETFGLSVLEALACGVAVVAAAGSGAAELVSPEPGGIPFAAGLAVEATPRGMAAGVLELLSHPEPERAVAARARASQFPWSAAVSRMLAIHTGTEPRPVGVPVPVPGIAAIPESREAAPRALSGTGSGTDIPRL
jgi:alpha-1,6-mannosyltransferase